jgi:hypothetical protein
MRGLKLDRLAGLRLPIGGEGGIDRLIELTCRIIGDIEQRTRRLRRRIDESRQARGERDDRAKAAPRD